MIDPRTFLGAAVVCLAARSAFAQPTGDPRRLAFLTAFDRGSADARVKTRMVQLDELAAGQARQC